MTEAAPGSTRREWVRALTLLIAGLITVACAPSSYRALTYGAGSRTVMARVLSCEQRGRQHVAEVRYMDFTGARRTATVISLALDHDEGAPGTELEVLELTHWPYSLTPASEHGSDVLLAWVAALVLLVSGIVLARGQASDAKTPEGPLTSACGD